MLAGNAPMSVATIAKTTPAPAPLLQANTIRMENIHPYQWRKTKLGQCMV